MPGPILALAVLHYPHIQTEQQLCMLYVFVTPIQTILFKAYRDR